MREALFSIWQERVVDAQVLDLFAGSGAVGIEAVSRGAGGVLFVEQAPAVVRLLEENCKMLEKGRWRLRRASLPGGLRSLAEHPDYRFDLIFADPPYAFDEYLRLLELASPLLRAGGELVVEHSARVDLAAAAGELRQNDTRRYGESTLTFYRSADDAKVPEPSASEEESDFLEVDP